jgi:hypothetical protein
LLGLAGCSRIQVPGSPIQLGVVNDTDIPVALFVNGQHVADYPPRQPGQALVSSSLPALPWDVEARSLGGTVLDTLSVDVGEFGGTRTGMIAGSIDLACGNLEIWAGTYVRQPSPTSPQPTAEFPQPCSP